MKNKIIAMMLAALLVITQIPFVNADGFFTSDNGTSKITSEETVVTNETNGQDDDVNASFMSDDSTSDETDESIEQDTVENYGVNPIDIPHEITSEEVVLTDQTTGESYTETLYIERGSAPQVSQEAYDDGISTYAALPEKYDPRTLGLVSPVENQGATGACWSYAAVAAAESNILKKGLNKSGAMPNLSELQLAYFFYHRTNDPLGNTAGDSNNVVGKNNVTNAYLKTGGSGEFTALFLSQWSGLANERPGLVMKPFAVNKNPNPKNNTALNSSLNYLSDYKLENAIFLGDRIWSTDKDVQDIKKAILEYGAVNIEYNAQGSEVKNGTYIYYPNDKGITHTVTLVGYDDTISKTNFKTKSGSYPSRDGAWIMKNSWGTKSGDSGYYYISYDTPLRTVIAYDYMSADTYERNYFYDGSSDSFTMYWNPEKAPRYANVFTAEGADAGKTEYLDAVSIGVYFGDTRYSIQVYTDLKDEKNPTSGTPMLKTPQTGYIGYKGVYTVPLDQSIELKPGAKFSVVVTLEAQFPSTIAAMMCASNHTYSWVQFKEEYEANQSFISNENSSWVDLATYNSTARIKALTNTMEKRSLEAEIKVQSNIWNTLRDDVTFNKFFSSRQSVTIDTSSEDARVYYYLSHESLSESAVKAMPDEKWTQYNGSFIVNPDSKYIVYAKVEDRWGNIVYLNSDGIVLDQTQPTITVNDGKDFEDQWYNTEQSIKLQVEDATSGIKRVTINGEAQELFVASGDEIVTNWNNADNPVKVEDGDHTYLITATDNSGNTLRYTLPVKQDTTAPVIMVNNDVEFGPFWYTTEQRIKLAVADYASAIQSISYRIDDGEEQSLFTSTGGRVDDWDNWANPIQVQEGTHTYEFTVVDNAGNSTIKTVTINQDTVAPTAEILVEGNGRNGLLTPINFSKLLNQVQKVTIKAEDSTSGVRTVEYYVASEKMNEQELKAFTTWDSYQEEFSINDNQSIVYAKVTDNAGNVTYVSSNGLVLVENPLGISVITNDGTINPIINNETYFGDTTFMINTENLTEVTVDGTNVVLDNDICTFTITANNSEHIIVVTDKAGNKTELTVRVNTKHTVTFVVDGEVIATRQQVKYGEAVTDIPQIPAKEGYDQIAPTWNIDLSNITSNITAEAVYTINTYTVQFVVDGQVVDTKKVNHGESVTNIPSIPVKEGYNQIAPNWDVIDLRKITSDMTVTAVYTANTYTVTFVVDGQVVDTKKVNHGEGVTNIPSIPVKEGYDQIAPNWDVIDLRKITSDMTVTAVYTANTYTVQFVVDGQVVDTKKVNHGDALTDIPNIPVKEGYDQIDPTWDVADFSHITSNMTVTAVYTMNTYEEAKLVDGIDHMVSVKRLRTVDHGVGFTFEVEILERYRKTANFAVKVNGVELLANADGTYTYTGTISEPTIEVLGLELDSESATAAVNQDELVEATVNQDELVEATVNQDEPVEATVNQDEPVEATANQDELVEATANQDGSVLQTRNSTDNNASVPATGNMDSIIFGIILLVVSGGVLTTVVTINLRKKRTK